MAEALIGPGAIRGTSPRIAWLSVLQGLGMLLVVLGHGWLTTFDDPEHGVVSAVVATIYHFHMPLFFAISGYLFWATRVTRDWSFPAVLGEKTLRFLWPFLVFTALAFSMKAFIPGLPGKRMLTNGWSALKVLAYPAQNPLGELWFIASLFTMFLLYPVLVAVRRHRMPLFLLLFASLVVAFAVPFGIDFWCLSYTLYFLPYFLLGALFCKERILSASEGETRPRFAGLPLDGVVVGLGLAVFLCEITKLQAPAFVYFRTALWISFCFSLSGAVARRLPGLFSSFRSWTYQIFLMGIFFQLAVRTFYRKIGIGYGGMLLVDVLLGLYGPVLVAKTVRRTGNRFAASILGL